jgi:hypothetical protein
MAKATFRKVYGKQGSGRFVVSEGIAPSTYLLPHEALPTLYNDDEDDRFEIVLTKGTILSVVMDSNGDSRIVPANGTSGAVGWGDADTVDDAAATPTNVAGDEDTVTVPAKSIPVGCAQYDLYRPFDKGTSQGAGWITHGFVEWPLVRGLNEDVQAGHLVRSDHMGRPVKHTPGTDDFLSVGKVIEVEYFGQNYDDGLLSYMQLPSDPGALQHVYELTKEGPYKGKLGIRANLDVTNVVGAMRVNLTLG